MLIWKFNVPKKIKVFLWNLGHKIMNAQESLGTTTLTLQSVFCA